VSSHRTPSAIAENLTGLGKKVLLIEVDIRKRVFAEYFDIKNKKGLLAVLSRKTKLEDAVVDEPALGADILIGEKAKTNAADIFSSERFREFLDELR
jgi:succinoglycan biosynthesis transport protein ExoP